MKTENRILIIGNFGIGAMEHFYANNLRKLGQSVHTFDIQQPVLTEKNKNLLTKTLFRINADLFYKETNISLMSFVEQLKPTIIIVFKGMELFPSTIEFLKNKTKLLCNYNPDHPFVFYSRGAGNENVEKSIQHYHVYMSYAPSIAKKVKDIYKVNTAVIPFGFDENLSAPPIKNTSYYGFIGAFDKTRLKQLSALKEFPIHVFGSENWEKHLKTNAKSYMKVHNKSLYLQDYANTCHNTDGVINFLREQNLIEQSHNMRTFEVPGYGGLLISERTEQQLSFFEEDKEAIYFSNIEELKDKINFLQKNKPIVFKIKTAAFERANKANYSYLHRAQELLNNIIVYV